jgi:hypothetical protein
VGDREADAVAVRLEGLANDLERTLGASAVVVRQQPGGRDVVVTPVRRDALGVSWFDTGEELQVETANGLGGCWELGRDEEDAAFLDNIVRSVVAGRVLEVSAGDRSRVEVTLADGSVAVQTGRVGLRSLLPKPGWKRSSERVQYAPYEG